MPGAGLAAAVPNTAAFLVGTQAQRRKHRLGEPDDTAPSRPRFRTTPGLVAQVAMDEALLGLLGGPSRLPTRADYERVGGEVREAEGLWLRRGWVERPL